MFIPVHNPSVPPQETIARRLGPPHDFIDPHPKERIRKCDQAPYE
jgi:hypothetical protein